MTDTYRELFEGIESLELCRVLADGFRAGPYSKQDKLSSPPTPKAKIPGNPCNDPYKCAPSGADKRAAVWTLKKSPQCYKLPERFWLVQSGIKDERDELLKEISLLERYCEEAKRTWVTQTSFNQEATAGETATENG